ncbi:hypothetical protein ADEAN_001051900 [Angomonas deanei]|uniref:Cilia- and flagella-associated protein 58 central coiled coil domain-containing protein n=1 Tax=Angomonas deanei TaxID=59799 RepID=A0A7G2CT38_9TRYP|nr:hypothetical protein ADEAN_001051900 [Angomonas deanei]
MTDVTTGITATALEALEQRYIEVLKELAGEPHLTELKNEYEKIHRLLYKSVEGEKRLAQRTAELKEELEQHKGKINTAMELSEEDETTILALRKDIERAWSLADSAHAREKESRELVSVLKKQIAELDKAIEKSVGLSVGQESYLYELLNLKKEREEEHAVLTGKLSRLAVEHKDLSHKVNTLNQEEEGVRVHLETLLNDYQNLLHDLEVQQKERQAQEQSVREYREATERGILDIEKAKQQLESLNKEKKNLTKESETLAEEINATERLITTKQEKFRAEADSMSEAEKQNLVIKKEIPKREAFLKDKEKQLAKVKREKEKVEEAARQQQAQLTQMVETREKLLKQQEALNEEVNSLIQQLQETEKVYMATELELKQEMQKKNRTLTDNSAKENQTAAVEGQKISKEGNKRRLLQELENKRVENEKSRKIVFNLEHNQTKEVSGAQKVVLQYQQVLDLIREKKSKQETLRHTLDEHEKRRKVQEELVARVRTGRNRSAAQWESCAEELQQLRQKAAAREEEINDLKNQLIHKEGELYKAYTLARVLDRDTKATEVRARLLEEDCQHADTRVNALETEVKQLHQVINKCEGEQAAQETRIRTIRNERNTLAGQVRRKEEELKLLRDKIQLQQATLKKGANEYNHRLEEIMEARDTLIETRLRCRLALIKSRMIETLKKREVVSQRQLWQEKVMTRGLTEELRNSTNVHRWRELEGSSPEMMDLIEKINLLQKKLIAKNDEVQEKAALVAQKEKEYQSLRTQLARLPGPEAAEELALFEENITKRDEQIQMLHGELQNVETRAEVLSDEVAELSAALAEAKHQFFEAKTKNDMLLREQNINKKTFSMMQQLETNNNNNNNFSSSVPSSSSGRRRSVSQPQTRLSAGSSHRNNNINHNNPYQKRKEKKKKEDELLQVMAGASRRRLLRCRNRQDRKRLRVVVSP